MTNIPATNEIIQFLHCRRCLEELVRIVQRTGQPTSPRTYVRYEVGFTELGVQIWCTRHELNVAHIWFEGHQHPANLNTANPSV